MDVQKLLQDLEIASTAGFCEQYEIIQVPQLLDPAKT